MNLNAKKGQAVLDRFLAAWNLDRIRAMTVAEYADLSNHDSFCYWLEYGTKELGAIGGIRLQKFELWKSNPSKVFRDGRFRLENEYAWNAHKGDNLAEAFEEIKKWTIIIVELSQTGDWEEIDRVPFHAIGKWKIAFLFSGKRLLPVYSRRALSAIATGLGLMIADGLRRDRFSAHE